MAGSMPSGRCHGPSRRRRHHPTHRPCLLRVGFLHPHLQSGTVGDCRSTCSTTSRRPRRCHDARHRIGRAPEPCPKLRGDIRIFGRGEWVDTMTTTGNGGRERRGTPHDRPDPTASGATEIEAWHYRPQGDRPHPAVVMAHGFAAVKAGGSRRSPWRSAVRDSQRSVRLPPLGGSSASLAT